MKIKDESFIIRRVRVHLEGVGWGRIFCFGDLLGGGGRDGRSEINKPWCRGWGGGQNSVFIKNVSASDAPLLIHFQYLFLQHGLRTFLVSIS